MGEFTLVDLHTSDHALHHGELLGPRFWRIIDWTQLLLQRTNPPPSYKCNMNNHNVLAMDVLIWFEFYWSPTATSTPPTLNNLLILPFMVELTHWWCYHSGKRLWMNWMHMDSNIGHTLCSALGFNSATSPCIRHFCPTFSVWMNWLASGDEKSKLDRLNLDVNLLDCS